MAPAIRVECIVPEPRTAGVTNGYRDPARLGADRWMALVGAHAMASDRSVLVCGFGTATTLDLLRHDGGSDATFIGGSILPGFEAMRAALRAHTARLDVPRGAVVDFADNTEDAIAGGVMLAQVGALREAWARACELTAARIDCVIAGGAGPTVVEALGRTGIVLHHVPDLVMRGLQVVADCWSAAADPFAPGAVGDA
jgi:type III pantothenate kinase